ncbi:MAG: hypothetical protein ACK2T7_06400, partial [Anaerolineales bacterium]
KVLSVCLNMIVTALADMGGKIYSMTIDLYGKKVTSPDLSPWELKFDLDYINKRLGLELKDKDAAELLKKDHIENPSHYAIAVISEGAKPIDGDMHMTGEADAFGHKKLGGIGIMTADELKNLTGINTLYQQLSYLMRSGAPDSLDLMVAVTFANMAMDLINRRNFGHMVALQDGLYTYVPGDTPSLGARSVDINALYDIEQYKPKLRQARGKPMFLY